MYSVLFIESLKHEWKTLGDDYYPIADMIEDVPYHQGLANNTIPLPDYRQIISSYHYNEVMPRYPWITHLILASEDPSQDQRNTEIALYQLPIGGEIPALLRYRLGRLRDDPSETATVISNQETLRAAISNPVIEAMGAY
jgi:hypothetical protein